MERPEIKRLIEMMPPKTAITFLGEKERMTIRRSGMGVILVGSIRFSPLQATLWVETIQPYSVRSGGLNA